VRAVRPFKICEEWKVVRRGLGRLIIHDVAVFETTRKQLWDEQVIQTYVRIPGRKCESLIVRV
jgi:hypothetical protein